MQINARNVPRFTNSKRLERGDVRIAQLAEQCFDKAKVAGSNPASDTTPSDGRMKVIMYGQRISTLQGRGSNQSRPTQHSRLPTLMYHTSLYCLTS